MMVSLKKQKSYSLFLCCFLAMSLFVQISLAEKSEEEAQEIKKAATCAERIKHKTVRDSSMMGVIDPGQYIKIDELYYKCRSIDRGHIVVVEKKPFKGPVFRIIKGMPGDKFSIEESKDKNIFHLQIAGEILRNPKGDFYELTSRQANALKIIAKSFEGTLPVDNYLVFSTAKQGEEDSRDFGPVVKGQIIGRVF